MSTTTIQWTDATWNPVTGCTKVSPGCKNCYAESIANRFWGDRKFTEVRCHEDRLDAPLHWKKRRRVFVNSMSDLFHEDVPDEFIERCIAIMLRANQHTFQVLTKRPERMLAICTTFNFVPENVWLGVSVEDQQRADERIPLLLQTPAAVRFLSCEPLLGPIHLAKTFGDGCKWNWLDGQFDGLQCKGANGNPDFTARTVEPKLPRIHWVIVGGESGNARPCNLAWIRSIVQQSKAAGVPVFVKQLGGNLSDADAGECARSSGRSMHDPKGGNPAEWPEDLRVREYPR